PRADKPKHEAKHEPKAEGDTGEGQPKKRKRRRGKGKGQGEGGQQPQQNQPRQANKPAAPLALPPERDPEEFLDDEFDNFGNRADYVPTQPKPQGRNPRRGGQGGGQGSAQPRGQGGQRQGGQKQGQGKPGGQRQGQGPKRGQGQGQRGNGGGRRRDEPRYERQEPAVQDSRAAKQPLIIRKGERLPTAEQLDSLSNSRPRGEKPALLTRKSDASE
ncbi:hypothetical protein ACPERO_01400, partial [Delftia sp. zbq_16]